MIAHLLAASSGSGGSLITLLVFMLPLGLLFVFMRNQQKRVKQQQSNQQAAQVGEDILTTSGIFGTIVDEDDEEGIVTVEIAPGTQIRMVRAGIARRITEDDYDDGDGYVDDDDERRLRRRARRERPGPHPVVSEEGAIGTPEGAPVPEVPIVEPPAAEAASIALLDVQEDPELSLYIASADRVMDAMGYTEHGFRHANLVAKIAYQVLHRLGYSEREAELACVAGYLHDVGNALARDAHGQTGAVMVYQASEGPCERPRPDADRRRDREPRGGRGHRGLADLGGRDPRGQIRRAPQPRTQGGDPRSRHPRPRELRR